MSKIKGFAAVLAAVAMVFVGNSAHADAPQLVWTARPMSASGDTIRMDGTLVYAYAEWFTHNKQTNQVNGVDFCTFSDNGDFKNGQSNVVFSPEMSAWDNQQGNEGLDNNYGLLLGSCFKCNTSGFKNMAMTLNGLEDGKRYLFQLITHWTGQSGWWVSAGGQTVYMGGSGDDDTWKYGGSLECEFVASGTSQAFAFTLADDAWFFAWNAIQVRELPSSSPIVRPADEIVAGYTAAQIDAMGQFDLMPSNAVFAGTSFNLPYRQHTPTVADGVKYPLVIFLHGVGERGNNTGSQAKDCQPICRYAMKHGDAYVIAPQCPDGDLYAYTWAGVNWNVCPMTRNADPTPQLLAVKELIEAMLDDTENYAIDPTRVYITGVSMGAFGTWDLVSRMSEGTVTAIMPCCGGADTSLAAAYDGIAIRFFHGSSDNVVSPQFSRLMDAALTSADVEHDYIEYAGVGHTDCYNTNHGYSDRNLAWLFGQIPGIPYEEPPLADPTVGTWTSSALSATGADEISTEGDLVWAFCKSDSGDNATYTQDCTVNGVVFKGTWAPKTGYTIGEGGIAVTDCFEPSPALTGAGDTSGEGLGSNANSYPNLIVRRWAGNSLSGTDSKAVFTFKGLEIGCEYLVQLFIHDGGCDKVKYIVAPDGTTKAYYGNYSTEITDCKYGSVLTGRFKASGTTQSFTFTYSDPGSYQLNAVQLRKVGSMSGWVAVPTAGDGSTVVTTGAVKYAYAYNTGVTINGVAFTGSSSLPSENIEVSPGFNANHTGFHSNNAFGSGIPGDPTSSDVKTLIKDAWYNSNGSQYMTVTFKGLEQGKTYLAQLFVCDNRVLDNGTRICGLKKLIAPEEDGSYGPTAAHFGATDASDMTWAFGGSLVGVFEATGTAYQVKFNCDPNNACQLNAVQVRELGVAPVIGTPTIESASVSVDGSTATFSLSGVDMGANAQSYGVYLAYAAQGASLPAASEVMLVQTAAAVSYDLTDLADGTYDYSIYVKNNGNVDSVAKTGSFTVAAGGDDPEVDPEDIANPTKALVNHFTFNLSSRRFYDCIQERDAVLIDKDLATIENLSVADVPSTVTDYNKAIALPQYTGLKVAHSIPTDAAHPYCLVIRFYSPSASHGTWRALYQTIQENNTDASLFLQNSDDGRIGKGGQTSWNGYYGSVSDDVWHSLVVSVDTVNSVSALYLDGTMIREIDSASGPNDLTDRPYIYFGLDNDGEDNTLYFDDIRIYNEAKPLAVFDGDSVRAGGPDDTIGGGDPEPPVYTLTIPAATGLTLDSVMTNGTPVDAASAGVYSIVSNTEVTVTFTAATGYTITGGNPVVVTVESDMTLAQFPTVQEQGGDEPAYELGWTSGPMSATGDTIDTRGDLVYAFCQDGGATGATLTDYNVNGVPFKGAYNLNNTINKVDGKNVSDYFTAQLNSTYGSCGDEGVTDAGCRQLLANCFWDSKGEGTTFDLTLKQLEVGKTYLVQITTHWSNQSGKRMYAPGSDKVWLQFGGTGWTYGGYLTGIFTANETEETFAIKCTGGTGMINSIQVREVTSGGDEPVPTGDIEAAAKELALGCWLAMPLTGDPSDFITNGTLAVIGSNMAGSRQHESDSTVQNIPFGGSNKANDHMVGNPAFSGNKDCGTGATCGLTGAYGNILKYGWSGASAAEYQTITFSGFDPAKTYLVQYIIHGELNVTNRYDEVTDVMGTHRIWQSAATAGEKWYYGGTLIHVFKPDSEGNYTLQIAHRSVDNKGVVSYQGGLMNAYQIREIESREEPVPPSTETWTAIPMTESGDAFSTDGDLVFAFCRDQADPGSTRCNEATSIPINLVNLLTDTVTSITQGPSINGVYDDGRNPGDFVAASPELSSATDQLGNEDKGNAWDTWGTILSHAWTGPSLSETDGKATFTFKGLTKGHKYLVEFFVHDHDQAKTVTAPDGETAITYGGTGWQYGGILRGTFTAEGATHDVVLTYSDSGSYMLNALQLRDIDAVEEAPVYTLTIPAKTGLALDSVTTNSVPVTPVEDVYSIVSNTEVTITFTAASGYELDGNDGVVTKTIKSNYTFVDADYPAVKESGGDEPVPTGDIEAAAKELALGCWLAMPLTGDPSDIVTNGVLTTRTVNGQVKKLSGAKSYGTVNGVDFGGSWSGDGGMTSSPNSVSRNKDFGSSATCGIEGQYGQVLKNAFDSGNNDGPCTFLFSGLDPAKTYLVQYIIHSTDAGHTATVTDVKGAKSIHLGATDSSDDWYYGGTLIHVFKPAQDGTYSLVIDYRKNDAAANAIVNAFQVREIDEREEPVPPSTETWTARAADSMGWNFSEDGVQIFAFRQDRGDATHACRNFAQNVPLTMINSLTDTITYHHNGKWDDWTDDNWSGVYNDGLNPSAYFAADPALPTRKEGLGDESAVTIWGNADDCFQGLLKTGFAGTRSDTGAATFTFKQLVPGHEYLAEIYVHSDSGSNSVTAPDGTTVAYFGGTDTEWKYGGFLTGRFTATEETRNFVFTFSNKYHINAVQLRDLTAPYSVNGEKWRAFQNAADPADTIVTTGRLVYAYAKGTYSVNGVDFVANSKLSDATDDISVSPGFSNDKDNYGGAVEVSDTSYKSMLGKGWIATSGYSYAFTFKKLTSGHRYVAQFIIHNSNDRITNVDYSFFTRVATGPANAPIIRYGSDLADTTSPWYYGGNFVIEFTADSTEHTTTLEYLGSAKGFICLNAVQLRDLDAAEEPEEPETPVYTLTIPAKTGLTLGSVSTNGTPVDAASAGVYSIVSNTQVTITFTAASGYELDGNDGVVTKTIESNYTFVDADYPAVKEQGDEPEPSDIERAAAELRLGCWLAVPLTGDPEEDIITVGTLAKVNSQKVSGAKMVSGTDSYFNGVAFGGSWNGNGGMTSSPEVKSNKDAVSDCGIEGAYGDLLKKAWDADNGATSAEHQVFNFEGLDPAKTYLVQYVLHGSSLADYSVTATDVFGPKTIQAYADAASDQWYYGGTLVHVFKPAANGTYSLTLDYRNSDGEPSDAFVNAFQLREVGDHLLPSVGVWTARAADYAGQNFTADGALVFSFIVDRSDEGTTCQNLACNVPFNLLYSLTDTVTAHKSNAWESRDYSINGVYGDGRQPADFISVSPALTRNSGYGHEADVPTLEDYSWEDCFGHILDTGFAGTANEDGKLDVTFKGLTPGHRYIAEIFVHRENANTKSVTAPDGKVAYFGGTVVETDDWKHGGILTGTFAATNVNHNFTFTYSDPADCHINAIQLRDLDARTDPNGTWIAVQNTASDLSVITDGKLKYAYANGDYTVNGVAFAANSMLSAATDNIEVAPGYGYDKADWVDCGVSGDYGKVLKSGWLNASGTPADSTITLKNLQPGKTYKVQLVVHNGNNTPISSRKMIAPDGVATVQYGNDNKSAAEDWYYGGSLIGTFVATGAVHQFTFTYSSSATSWKCLNAIQLRALDEVEIVNPAIGSVETESLGAGTSVKFTLSEVVIGTDALGAPGSSYSVWAKLDDGDAEEVVKDASGETATFTLTGLAAGDHVCTVYIENDLGATSDEEEVEFTVTPGYVTGWYAEPMDDHGIVIRDDGLLLYSYMRGNAKSVFTVNNVPFTGLSNVNLSESYDLLSLKFNYGSGFYRDMATVTSTDPYDLMLGYDWRAGGSGDRTLKLTGLESGKKYLVQLVLHDTEYTDGAKTYAPASDTVFAQASGDGWTKGGTLVGVFFATNSVHEFTLNSDKRAVLNAIQVRQVEDIDPVIGNVLVGVDGRDVIVSLRDILLGTDALVSPATKYDVWLRKGNGAAQRVLADQTATAVNTFRIENLAEGVYDYSVFITTDQDKTSSQISVPFTIGVNLGWIGEAMTSGGETVRTDGDLVYAYAFGNSYLTVNGVEFDKLGTSNFRSNDDIAFGSDIYVIGIGAGKQGSAELPADVDPESDYYKLLKYGFHSGTSSIALTLKNLDPEKTYMVQIFSHATISNPGEEFQTEFRNSYMTAPGDTSIKSYCWTDDWDHGGSLIGIFKPDGETQTFTLPTSGRFVFNGLQVREVAKTGEWIGEQLTADETVVQTDGTLVWAFCKNAAGVGVTTYATANGVTFEGIYNPYMWETTVITDHNGKPITDYFTLSPVLTGQGDQDWEGLDHDDEGYASLIFRGWQGTAGENGAVTLTLKGLEVGHPYEVQLFAHLAHGNAHAKTTLTSPDSHVSIKVGDDAGGGNALGGTLIGKFIADAAEQSFILTYDDPAGMCLNAIQLRDLTPVPPTMDDTVEVDVDADDATFTLTGISLGTDGNGVHATSYDVYCLRDGAISGAPIATGLTGDTAEVTAHGFYDGHHVCQLYIVTDVGTSTEPVEVEFDIDESGLGIWIARPMDSTGAAFVDEGDPIFMLCKGAHGQGQTSTITISDYVAFTGLGRFYDETVTVDGKLPTAYLDMSPRLENEHDDDPEGLGDATGTYGQLVKRSVLNMSGDATGQLTVTLKGLEVGEEYVVQLMMHHTEKYNYTVTAPDTVAVAHAGHDPASGSDEWKYGGSLIGRFTAKAETQDFTFYYDKGGETTVNNSLQRLNAIQLRRTSNLAKIASAAFEGNREKGTITVSGIEFGYDTTECDVYLAYAPKGSTMPAAVKVNAEPVTTDSYAIKLTGLDYPEEYEYSVFISNTADHVSRPVTGSFTTVNDFGFDVTLDHPDGGTSATVNVSGVNIGDGAAYADILFLRGARDGRQLSTNLIGHITSEAELKSCSYELTGLTEGADYRWAVVATNDIGLATEPEFQSFHVNDTSSPTQLTDTSDVTNIVSGWVWTPMTRNASLIVHEGELRYSYVKCDGGEELISQHSMNGVGFTGVYSFNKQLDDSYNVADDIIMTPAFSGGIDGCGTAGLEATDVHYLPGTLQRGFAGTANSDGKASVTLRNLVPGEHYIVQLIFHNDADGVIKSLESIGHPGNLAATTVTAPNGASVQYGGAVTGGNGTDGYTYDQNDQWLYGGTLVGVFTASDPEQTFDLEFSVPANYQLNGVQVRRVYGPGETPPTPEKDTTHGTWIGKPMGFDPTTLDAVGFVTAGEPVWAFCKSAAAEDIVGRDEDGQTPAGIIGIDFHRVQGIRFTGIYSPTTECTLDGTEDGPHASDYFEFDTTLEGRSDKYGAEDVTKGNYPELNAHAYQSLLTRGWEGVATVCPETDPAYGTTTLTLHQLEPGQTYVVQLTYHFHNLRNNYVTAPDKVTKAYFGDNPDPTTGEYPEDGWRYGGTLIGTFTATNEDEEFTFKYGAPGYCQVNSIQLRKAENASMTGTLFMIR